MKDDVSTSLVALASYMRENSDMGYVTATVSPLSDEELKRRKAEVCRLSDALDELAGEARRRRISTVEFEAIRDGFQALGKMPPSGLVRDIASAIVAAERGLHPA